MVTYRVRDGTVHGVRHARLGVNNQDVVLSMEFSIPAWGRHYCVGLVSDGCTGIPAFSHSEFGANLIVLSALARIQELCASGCRIDQIPLGLYPTITATLRHVAHIVIPPTTQWPYPVRFRGKQAFRNELDAQERFRADYLSATLAGFVDDGETLATFRAGDGIDIVNDEVTVIDQNNNPDYPALSVNAPGSGFVVRVYPSVEVKRLALLTDGPKELLDRRAFTLSDGTAIVLPDAFFTYQASDPLGFQDLLITLRETHEELMGDDCSGVTRVREDDQAS